MQAILLVTIDDWSNGKLPKIEAGTPITVQAVDYREEGHAPRYLGFVTVDDTMLVFGLDKHEFEAVV